MTTKIAINGLGRIGRCVLRALQENGAGLDLIAVNGPAAAATHVHLLKYDSVHGRFGGTVEAKGEDALIINGHEIKLLHEKDPAKLNWAALGVDLVLECSGKFNSKEAALAHIRAGAKKVLVSAPADGADATIVYGVNNGALKSSHEVVSVGSCTTNALAPLAKALNDAIGIERGFMTTIHAYTGDQNLVDGSHKDLRRARAAAMSMIPTSTGAAKALGLVLPELEGKLDGVAIRVPTANVSLVDLVFEAKRNVTKDEVNAALKAAESPVLAVTDEPLVSIDFTGHPASSIVDLTATKVVGGRTVRVASWYDNEWGFSNRMLDVAKLWGTLN
jgi:glyceraldehyde 3-phosphate dehydrogenase